MIRLLEKAVLALATLLLLSLSSAPATARSLPRQPPARVDIALNELHETIPDVRSSIVGRRVLDFGSGVGAQSVALAENGATEVIGVEISDSGRQTGAELAAQRGVDGRVRFVQKIGSDEKGHFDTCISLNSMEHFSDPQGVLEEIRSALRPGGRLLLTFAPPWYSPYGAHMAYFTSIPWVHLLFPERAVMAVRGRYRNDGAQRYEDVTGGLNRMSLAKFERLVRDAGFEMVELRYTAVKGLPLVTRIPFLRELLTSRVTAVLQRPLDPARPSRSPHQAAESEDERATA